MSAAPHDPVVVSPSSGASAFATGLEPAQALDACLQALHSFSLDPRTGTPALTSVVALWRTTALRWVQDGAAPAEVAGQLDRLIEARLPEVLARLDRDERARTFRVVDRLGAWAVAGIDDTAAACALADDLRDRVPTRLARTRRAQARRRRGPERLAATWAAAAGPASDPAAQTRQVVTALRTGQLDAEVAVGAVTRLVSNLRKTRAAGPLAELAGGLMEAPVPLRRRLAPAVVSAGLAVAGPQTEAQTRAEDWRLLLRCLALSPQDARLVERVELGLLERGERRRRFAAVVACGFILASAAVLALQLPA